MLVSQRSGVQAAAPRQRQTPVDVVHEFTVEPPLQSDAVVHGSQSSVVVLQRFGPQTSRAELVHAGKHTPVLPDASAMHA